MGAFPIRGETVVKTLVLSAWIGLTLLPGPVFGSQRDSQAPKVLQVTKVRDNFYMLNGGSGNTSVFITKNNGVVVVDVKLPGWGSLIVDQIKSITDKPITTVILTKGNADQVGGLPEFPADIQIVAHENTKANMVRDTRWSPGDLFKKPENAKYLPNKTFKDKLTLFSGEDQVDVYYFGAASTNGDAWIVFPSLGILIPGDNFSGKGGNLIDETAGGTGAQSGIIRHVVNTFKNVDTVIPGHFNGIYTWDDFKEYADYNDAFTAWALAQKKAGKTVDEAAAEYKHPASFADYRPARPLYVKMMLNAIYNTPGLD
jgi:cyclase